MPGNVVGITYGAARKMKIIVRRSTSSWDDKLQVSK